LVVLTAASGQPPRALRINGFVAAASMARLIRANAYVISVLDIGGGVGPARKIIGRILSAPFWPERVNAIVGKLLPGWLF